MLKRILALALISVGFVMTQVQAAEPTPAGRLTTETIIKRTLEGRLGGAKIDAVSKTPYLGLYEVRLGSETIYTDEKMNYIFSGDILDAKSMQNLTKIIRWDSLPLRDAFKTVRGNGKRVLAVFSDPNCPYCKRFEKDLAKIDDITIYTFLYPILSQDSHDKSKAVWCSADKVKAWNELMLNAVVPASAAAQCDTPIDKNLALGQKYGISGTPTMIFANGDRVPGAIPAERLEKLLAQNTK